MGNGIETKTIVDINKTANQFKSSIVINVNNKHIDAKSILGLSMILLGSDKFALEIHGPDEEDAKSAMVEVFKKHSLDVVVM